jgi:hypothetical protein
LKTAVAMIERRAIPKIGSFVDKIGYEKWRYIHCFELRQPGIPRVDSALRLETNSAFVATNDKRQTVDAHLA